MMCSTPQHLDGVLDHGQAIQVGVDHEVGDVAVDEDFAGGEAENLVGGNAAVGATDPKELRRLDGGKAIEKAGVGGLHAARPFAIIFEKQFKIWHGSCQLSPDCGANGQARYGPAADRCGTLELRAL